MQFHMIKVYFSLSDANIACCLNSKICQISIDAITHCYNPMFCRITKRPVLTDDITNYFGSTFPLYLSDNIKECTSRKLLSSQTKLL